MLSHISNAAFSNQDFYDSMNDFHETRNSPAIKKNVDYEINDKWNYLEQTPDFRYSYARYNRNDYDEYQDGKMYEKDI